MLVETKAKVQIADIEDTAKQEAKQQYAERQEKKFGRLADFSLDPENPSISGEERRSFTFWVAPVGTPPHLRKRFQISAE